jgi:integrase
MATIRRLRGKWQAQVRRKGLPPKAKSFTSKADAEKWARGLEAELDRSGVLPDTRVAESMTVRELLERYLVEITPHKRSAETETYRIKALMKRDIAYRTLAMLSSADVAAYRDERLKVVSTASVIRELNTLAHAIDVARKEWGVHLVQNPVRMIRRPSPPRGRDRRLNGDEEQRLLEAADAGRSRYMRPLIILAIETAMRQGELLSLTWNDIDLDKRIAHLDMTKNGESRDVPLSSRALEALARIQTDAGGRARRADDQVRGGASMGSSCASAPVFRTFAFMICATRVSAASWSAV